MQVLNCNQLKQQVEHGAKLIDVREPAEFARGKLPGATNIPLASLGQALEQFTPSDTILVYCHTGNRSGYAEMALKSRGYERTLNIGGVVHYHECIA